MNGSVWVVAAAVVGALDGCTSGGGDAIRPLGAAEARQDFVKDVVVTEAPATVEPGFKEQFAEKARVRLARCAKGPNPLRAEIIVDEYHKGDPGQALLIGDTNRVRGRVKLLRETDNSVAGEYDINHAFSWGGIAGAIALSAGGSKMGEGFADEICNQAFPSRS